MVRLERRVDMQAMISIPCGRGDPLRKTRQVSQVVDLDMICIYGYYQILDICAEVSVILVYVDIFEVSMDLCKAAIIDVDILRMVKWHLPEDLFIVTNLSVGVDGGMVSSSWQTRSRVRGAQCKSVHNLEMRTFLFRNL